MGRLVAAGHYAPTTANGWLSILRVVMKAVRREFELPMAATEGVDDFDASEWVTYPEEEPNSLAPDDVPVERRRLSSTHRAQQAVCRRLGGNRAGLRFHAAWHSQNVQRPVPRRSGGRHRDPQHLGLSHRTHATPLLDSKGRRTARQHRKSHRSDDRSQSPRFGRKGTPTGTPATPESSVVTQSNNAPPVPDGAPRGTPNGTPPRSSGTLPPAGRTQSVDSTGQSRPAATPKTLNKEVI